MGQFLFGRPELIIVLSNFFGNPTPILIQNV